METPEQILASSSFVLSSAPQSHNIDPSLFFVLMLKPKRSASNEALKKKALCTQKTKPSITTL